MTNRLVRWVHVGCDIEVRMLDYGDIMPGVIRVEAVKGQKVKLTIERGVELIVKESPK